MTKKSIYISIVEYSQHRIDSIKALLTLYATERGEETLHTLRVDIKKLRAVDSLVQQLNHQLGNTQSLKKIFRKAGKIRELQINRQIRLKLSQPTQSEIDRIAKIEKKLSEKFARKCHSYLRDIDQLNLKVGITDKVQNEKATLDYFHHLQEKAALASAAHDRYSLHQYRKIIKKILYCYEALPMPLKKKVKLNTRFLDQIQNRIGRWHDTLIAIKQLKKASSNGNDKALLIRLRKKEKKLFSILSEAQ
jgi:CHAD domain-containing protein